MSGPEPELAARIGMKSDPHPVAATVVEDGVPFVFVNAGRPVVLQRFALVHAFAHLVLGHGDVVDESIGWSRANPREAAANDFAEEFLAPVRAVDRWYGRRAGPAAGARTSTRCSSWPTRSASAPGRPCSARGRPAACTSSSSPRCARR